MAAIPQLFKHSSQATRILAIASITALAAVGATTLNNRRYDRVRLPPSHPNAHSFHEAAIEANNYARPIITQSGQSLFSRLIFYEFSL